MSVCKIVRFPTKSLKCTLGSALQPRHALIAPCINCPTVNCCSQPRAQVAVAIAVDQYPARRVETATTTRAAGARRLTPRISATQTTTTSRMEPTLLLNDEIWRETRLRLGKQTSKWEEGTVGITPQLKQQCCPGGMVRILVLRVMSKQRTGGKSGPGTKPRPLG